MKFLASILLSLFCASALAAPPPIIWGAKFSKILQPGLQFTGVNGATACTAATAGSIRYNSGTFEGCNGTAWSAMTGGGGGTPGGANGAVQFNNSSAFGGDATNFFWDSTNKRLGLGTNTPGFAFTVVNANGGYTGDFKNTVGGSLVKLESNSGQIVTLDAQSGSGNNFIGSESNDPFALRTNNAIRLFIDASGQVGINTTTPGNMLEINGTSAVTGFTSTPSSSVSGVYLSTSSNNPSFLLSRSINSANQKMWDAALISDGVFKMRAVDDAYSTARSWIDVTGGSAAITSVVFPEGNVGVGAASPAGNFQVLKTQDAATTSYLNNAGTGANSRSFMSIGEDTSSKNMGFGYSNSSFNIGAGFELLGADTGWIFSNTSANGLTLFAAKSGGFIRFGTGGFASANERMRIDGSGLVGIGTASPGYPLDINPATDTAGLRLRGAPGAGTGAAIILDASLNGAGGLPFEFFSSGSGNGDIGGSKFGIRDLSQSGATSYRLVIDSSGHIIYGGSAPAVSACGTSPSVAGNDVTGRITVGTGGVATSCTLTFAHAFAHSAVCTIGDESTSLLLKGSASTTVLTITAATPFGASDKIVYNCFDYE